MYKETFITFLPSGNLMTIGGCIREAKLSVHRWKYYSCLFNVIYYIITKHILYAYYVYFMCLLINIKELTMFNYLHKKFYTKYGHVLAAIFISMPTYLKHSEPEKSNKTKIQYWKHK